MNLAVPRASRSKSVGWTGIDKLPAVGPVLVRAPGPKHGGLGSGLAGDTVCDTKHHGGDDQAVYAYAREDYDWWEQQLGRALHAGTFGENLTTVGAEVSGAVLGERWRIGADLVLQVRSPRIPCATFQGKMGLPGWIKRFTREARPGAYFSVVSPGEVSAGDRVTIESRPAHGITVAEAFRALTLEPELLPRLAAAEGADPELLERALRATP